jgi:hypothetical protein
MPGDAMEVEDAEKVVAKIKSDDDPENEGAYMRLSLLRFRMTRFVPPRLCVCVTIECGRWCWQSPRLGAQETTALARAAGLDF